MKRIDEGGKVMRSEEDSDIMKSEEGYAGHKVRRKVK